MAPRSKEQFKEIRENKKELIRMNALKLFAEKGYHTTSISMIATEANISKGLMYNYYSSKELLLRDIVESGFRAIINTLVSGSEKEISDINIEAMILLNKEMINSDLQFWRLYFSIIAQPSILEIVKEEALLMYDQILSIFKEYFRKNGYEDPGTEAVFLGSVLDGIFLNYILNPDKYPLDKVLDKIITMYTNK